VVCFAVVVRFGGRLAAYGAGEPVRFQPGLRPAVRPGAVGCARALAGGCGRFLARARKWGRGNRLHWKSRKFHRRIWAFRAGFAPVIGELRQFLQHSYCGPHRVGAGGQQR
jgi:hypothetical protein